MKYHNRRSILARRFLALQSSATALFAFAALVSQPAAPAQGQSVDNKVRVIHSYHNDVSPALRDLPPWPVQTRQQGEGPENPPFVGDHVDQPDAVIQSSALLAQLAPSIPAPILNFNGIPYPGVGCSCAPPDTTAKSAQLNMCRW